MSRVSARGVRQGLRVRSFALFEAVLCSLLRAVRGGEHPHTFRVEVEMASTKAAGLRRGSVMSLTFMAAFCSCAPVSFTTASLAAHMQRCSPPPTVDLQLVHEESAAAKPLLLIS